MKETKFQRKYRENSEMNSSSFFIDSLICFGISSIQIKNYDKKR